MFQLNQLDSLGSLKDRAETISIVPQRGLSYAELDVLYTDNHVVADFTDLVVEDVEGSTNYRGLSTSIDLKDCFLARSKARLYGWAFLIFDGTKIKSLSPQECDYDFTYRTNQEVTQVIDLYEDKVYKDFKLVQYSTTMGRIASWQTGDGLGISPVRRFYKDALRYQLLSNVFTNLMIEKKVSRLRVKDLFDKLNDDTFIKSIIKMNSMRDILGLDLSDMDETEHQLEEKNLSGLKDMLAIYMDILSGATDIPKARLFNLSPESQSSGSWESDVWNAKLTKEFGKIAELLKWGLEKMGLADVKPYLNKELGVEQLALLVEKLILTPEEAKLYLDNYLN